MEFMSRRERRMVKNKYQRKTGKDEGTSWMWLETIAGKGWVCRERGVVKNKGASP